MNGDVQTVAGLIANPGPDGISLREAIEATNNDPGTYTIRFAAALAGKTIVLAPNPNLPPLSGGGVSLDGDLDGNGDPDVAIRPRSTSAKSAGFVIHSSHNRLRSLTLQGFTNGVLLEVGSDDPQRPRTIVDNVISGLVLRDIGFDGILFGSSHGPGCGLPRPQPCRSFTRVANITITGNTIDTVYSGIAMGHYDTVGDRIEDVTVTDNRIRYGKKWKPGLAIVGIHLVQGGTATRTLISNVVIARNSLEGGHGDGGIVAYAGAHRAQANTIQRLRILDNEIELVQRGRDSCCQGITVAAGSERPELIYPNVKPVRYPDRNVVREVQIRGNSVSGDLVWGVQLWAGIGAGGSRNRLDDVDVSRNVISISRVGFGVYAALGDGMPYKRRYAMGNRIIGLTIDANRITIKNRGLPPHENLGGVVLEAGGAFSRGGVMREVRITRNRIATAQPGIWLIGGTASTARRNRIACVRLVRNVITRTRRPILVTPNIAGAAGNRVSLGGC